MSPSLIAEVDGRSVTYVNASDEDVRMAMLRAGVDEWFAGALIELYQAYRHSGVNGYASRVTDTVQQILGRPARSLRALLGELNAEPGQAAWKPASRLER